MHSFIWGVTHLMLRTKRSTILVKYSALQWNIMAEKLITKRAHRNQFVLAPQIVYESTNNNNKRGINYIRLLRHSDTLKLICGKSLTVLSLFYQLVSLHRSQVLAAHSVFNFKRAENKSMEKLVPSLSQNVIDVRKEVKKLHTN